MKKDFLNFEGIIQNGGFINLDPKWIEKWVEFKKCNDGKHIKLSYECLDAVAYFQHKYLNGFVIPQIMVGQGELDEIYVTEMLKEKFLKQKYEEFRDIPSRHKSRCRIMMIEKILITGETVIDKYFIPSRATLTYDEMKNFIIKCEGVRDNLIDWSMLEKDKEKIKAMLEARKLAFQEDGNQGDLFK